VFLFDLAGFLGRSVADLEDSLTLGEIEEWMHYCSRRPFGERAAWIRHGQLMALLANVHRDPKRPPFKPTDFIPQWHEARVDGTDSDLVRGKFLSVFGERVKQIKATEAKP